MSRQWQEEERETPAETRFFSLFNFDMPSYIAIAATALASIHERLLPIPLLVLSGLIPPFAFVVQYLLLWPFTLAAKAIKSIGVLLQMLYLLEGILSGAAGEGLNS